MPAPLLPTELAALAEIAGLATQEAAVALSRLMGKPVRMEPPRLSLAAPGELVQLLGEGGLTALDLKILGELRGRILILFPQESSRRALELLLGRPPAPGAHLSELEASALREIGNVLASACLNALGASLKMTLFPSVPRLSLGGATAPLAASLPELSEGAGPLLSIETGFSIAVAACSGSIFLLPAPASLDALQGALSA